LKRLKEIIIGIIVAVIVTVIANSLSESVNQSFNREPEPEPEVIIDNYEPYIRINAGEKIETTFVVKNIGKEPARNCQVEWYHHGFDESPTISKPGFTQTETL